MSKEDIQQDDQIRELDRIAKDLVRRDLELSEVRAKQEQQIQELDQIAKTLVRRDLELSEVRTKQEEQIIELERVARILVRRDAELNLAKERLERLSIEKSEFLSIVAHQLRTPLTGIKWPLSVLGKAGKRRFTEKEIELIRQSLRSTERMIALVNDFLNVVRIEEGRLAYAFRLHDIRAFIKEAVELFRDKIKEKALIFRLVLDKNIPKQVLFDDEKMLMVVQNVLDNAIKFTPPKGKVSFVVKQVEKEFIFSVTDTGIGIPKDEFEKIFHKFSMASNAMMYEGGKGTGLGLYLIKNIIEAHGGRIWFTSEESKGTTFYFTLPLKM